MASSGTMSCEISSQILKAFFIRWPHFGKCSSTGSPGQSAPDHSGDDCREARYRRGTGLGFALPAPKTSYSLQSVADIASGFEPISSLARSGGTSGVGLVWKPDFASSVSAERPQDGGAW
jgi:hypothetical protein